MKVVISGGSRGIGLEIARILGQQGNEVYTLDIIKAKEKLPQVNSLIADVANTKQVRSALNKIGNNIDVLVSNAAIIRRGAMLDSCEEDFDLLFRVNVKGSWLLLKEAKPFLSVNPVVMQISSGHVLKPPKDPGIYTWTKQILAIFVDNLRRDYPQYSLKVAFPGPVDTALARFGLSKQELAEKQKIMHSSSYVATRIVELLLSENNTLLFDEASWDYVLA